MSDGFVQMALKPSLEELPADADLLSVRVLGVDFALRWGGEVTWEQRESMRSAWSRCAGAEGNSIRPLTVDPSASLPFAASVAYSSTVPDGGSFLLQAASFEELAENLTSRLTVAAILANAGKLTMLHACGIADPATGATVALVAKSGTGKTTAASVLARTYGYITDETVAIGQDGSVLPYPKPLSVKQGTGAPKLQIGPDELGLLPAPARPFLQSVVLLNRVEATSPSAPTLSRVPLADAVLALIPDSSSQGRIHQPLQSLCRLIDSVGGVWLMTYSEAADLPTALEPLFQKQPPVKPEWSAAAPTRDETAGTIPAGHIRRSAPKDAVTIGQDLLLMLDEEIVRLSGIGPAIWEATECAVPLDRVAEEVGDVHGRPEGYRSAVPAAVEQLLAKSVLEHGSR